MTTARRRKAKQAWEQGRQFSRAGNLEAAADAFSRAAELDPEDALFAMNAARACLNVERIDDSIRFGRQAVQSEPRNNLARVILTVSLDQAQRYEELVELLQSVPPDMSRTPEMWAALGEGCKRLGRFQEAISAYLSALALRIDDALLHYHLGMTFYEVGMKEEAAECMLTVTALGIKDWDLHVQALLAYCERENCRWDRAQPALVAMQAAVDELTSDSAVVTCMFAHATLLDDPVGQLKAARAHSNTARHLAPVTRAALPRDAQQRIRLGYLSADFHAHATCILLVEMLERRDSTRFEVFLYSMGKGDKSAMRQRIEHACDHFVDVVGMSDQRIAERIADDGIELLIDLKGYTAQNRFGIMARRPAPLQVSYLGYPGTMGSDCIDYIVGDPIVTPLAHAAHFSEKIAQLPNCYQPNDSQRPRPQGCLRSDHGLPDEALVLCGFNQAYKISPEVLDVWCDLLKDIPGSLLWLLDWHGQAKPNLMREIEARGIAPDRIVWAPRKNPADHITRLQLADVFLDTWPTNGHTTASDALWAGVPIVTLMGQVFASRVAGSLLKTVGLAELATANIDEYKSVVKRLAAQPHWRRRLQEQLAQARDDSPLFDAKRYAADFEALLLRMLARQHAGLAPDHLPSLVPHSDGLIPSTH